MLSMLEYSDACIDSQVYVTFFLDISRHFYRNSRYHGNGICFLATTLFIGSIRNGSSRKCTVCTTFGNVLVTKMNLFRIYANMQMKVHMLLKRDSKISADGAIQRMART